MTERFIIDSVDRNCKSTNRFTFGSLKVWFSFNINVGSNETRIAVLQHEAQVSISIPAKYIKKVAVTVIFILIGCLKIQKPEWLY